MMHRAKIENSSLIMGGDRDYFENQSLMIQLYWMSLLLLYSHYYESNFTSAEYIFVIIINNV
jgi:hypothetical protein